MNNFVFLAEPEHHLDARDQETPKGRKALRNFLDIRSTLHLLVLYGRSYIISHAETMKNIPYCEQHVNTSSVNRATDVDGLITSERD